MKLFIDNNLPPVLADGLGALFLDEHQVVSHRSKFGNTHIKDEEWIPALGAEGGWTVLSGDLNIARKRPTRELFLRSRLVGFFPKKAVMELPLHKKASRILYVWERIEQISSLVKSGVYELQISGDKFPSL